MMPAATRKARENTSKATADAQAVTVGNQAGTFMHPG